MSTSLKGKQQLQEVYRHLDHTTNGNVYLAWYGQCRAQEMTHAEALEHTIEHFHLRSHTWYNLRMESK